MPRLFIAADLPDMLNREFGGLHVHVQAKGFRWVPPAQIHLTLTFIGDSSAETLARIRDGLGSVRFSSFSLALSDIGFFPSQKRPSVLWIGCDGGDALRDLKAKIDSVLSNIGVAFDTRPFTPHITLARLKARPDGMELAKIRDSLSPFRGRIAEVGRFYLYSSIMLPQGVEHTVETVRQAEK